jgi:DNA primase catalytic core
MSLDQKNKIRTLNKLAMRFYSYILESHKYGEPGRLYLEKRGIPEKQIKQFNLGYAPGFTDSLQKYLYKKGYSQDDLLMAGLIVLYDTKVLDKFRNRVVFPISEDGHVLGFSGRTVLHNTKAPKYLNSPDTLIYSKSDSLFGLDLANKRRDRVVLAEGNLDVVSSHMVGVNHIVAPLGTAVTIAQLRKIRKYWRRVEVCFDNDLAGTRATIKTLKLCKQIGLPATVLDIWKYKDLDELIHSGLDVWTGATTFNLFCYIKNFINNRLLTEYNTESAEGLVGYLNEIFTHYIELDYELDFTLFDTLGIKKLTDVGQELFAAEKAFYLSKIAGNPGDDDFWLSPGAKPIETPDKLTTYTARLMCQGNLYSALLDHYKTISENLAPLKTLSEANFDRFQMVNESVAWLQSRIAELTKLLNAKPSKRVDMSDKIELAKQYPIANLLMKKGIEVSSHGFASCPFHSEKTASLKIYTDSNQAHCFGCNRHFDAISVYRELWGAGFNEAIIALTI